MSICILYKRIRFLNQTNGCVFRYINILLMWNRITILYIRQSFAKRPLNAPTNRRTWLYTDNGRLDTSQGLGGRYSCRRAYYIYKGYYV